MTCPRCHGTGRRVRRYLAAELLAEQPWREADVYRFHAAGHGFISFVDCDCQRERVDDDQP